MSNLIDDPRLTAYALGELPEDQRQEFEMELNKDEKAKKEVQAIRELAGDLETDLLKEETTRLDLEQKASLTKDEKKGWFFKPWQMTIVGGALATVLITVVLKDQIPVYKMTERVYDKVSSPKVEEQEMVAKQDLPVRAPVKQVLREERKIVSKKEKMDSKFRPQKITALGRSRMAKKMKSFNMASSEALAPGVAGGMPSTSSFIAPMPQDGEFMGDKNTESYEGTEPNRFTDVAVNPLSTFSIDVDTASYSNSRRFLTQGKLPFKDSVRVEEFINYFDYTYPEPSGDHPFSVQLEVADSPWHKGHQLVRIGLKGKEVRENDSRGKNIVFLLDVSGSMRSQNKLPLLKESLKIMMNSLSSDDKVAIAVYAGASGLVLDATPVSEKKKILDAFDRLKAGGSTNAGSGILLAYDVAKKNFVKGGVNRVILATDGDFNVGLTNRGSLIDLVKEKSQDKIFLTVLGLGMGNYKDAMLEKIANKGNGNYAYLDTIKESKKVLVDELAATLTTIAKDVKIQVEFNPAKVKAYRLVGYENRKLAAKDFNDDKKDAGEIGAGHKVTAIYEIVPTDMKGYDSGVDSLKYQKAKTAGDSGDLLTVKLRYKEPEGKKSKLIEVPLPATKKSFEKASDNLRFATAVASFAMLIRKDQNLGEMNITKILEIAQGAKGADKYGYRQEFIELVEKAQNIHRANQGWQ